MLWVKRITFLMCCQCLLIAAQGPGPGPGPGPGKTKSSTKTPDAFGGSSVGAGSMQSRAVDTRISLEVKEGLPSGTVVGSIPVKENFTYRFNEPPLEFSLDAYSGVIRTTTVLDRESFRSDRFDLVVLSSQPTYPIEVRIVVTDINDNAPEFPEPSTMVTFSESSAPGTRLLLDSAFDKDSGINGILTYDIVDGNKDQKFRINVTSNPSGEMSYLHLETTGNLDRENQAFYHLNVSARDGGDPPLSGYLQVNVTILDVNDNPPMFDHSDYNVSMNETAPPGTSVLQVRATDNDIGDNAKITYYLEDIGRQFAIDSETGVISTTEPLRCVRQQNCSDLSFSQKACPKSCVISVSAWDHGSPRQVGRAYVTVNLVEVNTNDHDPIINFTYFLRPAKFATVDENAANGSVVAAVTVVDLDEGLNGETTVFITAGNELNHFRLDSTPAVRVNGILDREEISKYNLTIVATDKGIPPRSSTANLIIFVNDVNDHEPVFEKSEYSAVLSELSPPGTYVAGITATDEDTGVNAQIYYAFVSGNERNWFEINTESGLVTTNAAIDREVQGSVELKISARDGGPNPKWAYTQLKVTILDENDRRPEFSQNEINVTLSEDTPPNTLVAILTASDADQGTNGSVTYFLDEDSGSDYSAPFVLDSLTGQLTTKTTLDRERLAQYVIRVVAKDQGIPSQSSTATVHLYVENINDNSPKFYPLKYFAPVSANLPVGHSILQVFAHDDDEGENADLRYSMLSDREELFRIDSKTGIISTASSLKYTKSSLFKMEVSVRDSGGRICLENAVVEIVKDTYIKNLEFDVHGGYEFKIIEDDSEKPPLIGSPVGRIRVRSGESDGSKDGVSYFITEGDQKGCFAIDNRTGVITRNKAIDREEKEFYSLTCIARMNLAYGKIRVNITVTDVNDNRPVFQREKAHVEVDENAPVGLEIFHAKAQDKDFGPNSRFRYSLAINPEEKFRINEATGVVYLNKKIHKNPGSIIVAEIVVTDFGEPSLSSKQTLVITVRDVNDHTPVFDQTSYETSLLESTKVNERFFRLSASDADLDLNGLVCYVITEGNNEGRFGIFPDGYLYLKSPLDREQKDYYSLVVTASDRGESIRSSSVSVVVHVIDENDNPPQFTNSTFTFHIKENEPPDSFVGKLTATDEDTGRNAELTFSFANAQNEFVVDPKNGFVKTLVVFDREGLTKTTGRNFISVDAVVYDSGVNKLKDKATVNVYVDDVNDNAPVFLKTPYKVQISEGSAVETQVIRVHASDLDEGINGDLYFELVDGNEEQKFSIERETGQIILVNELDREKTSRYMLTVLAEDGALTGRLSASVTVVVDVLDENDNAPKFAHNQALKVSVPETISVHSKLNQFEATDADLGVNSEVIFSIGAGNRRDTFHVDPTSGNLYLNKPLDYEELNSYSLLIVASDGGNPRLSSTVLFNITVEDCNDNSPVFPNTALVRQILEGIPVNKAIVTVTAEDPDSEDNGRVTYSIVNQEPEMANREMHFGINPTTGVIFTLLPIDREAVDTFLLTVVATDQAVPESARLSSEKLVTVIVEDINDNAPIFTSMNAAVLPGEGTFIMRVHAKDLDSNTNGLVKYDLIGGDVDPFNLDINSGALTLKRALVVPKPKYHLAVKATDEAVQSERKSTEAYITLLSKGGGNVGPKFANENPSGSISENEPPGKSILTLSASLSNIQVEYFVTNVTGNGKQVYSLFAVDAKTGVLSNAVALDRETGPEFYVVEVYAVGANASEPCTSSIKVRINVLDKNDSPPSFKNVDLDYSISEDLPVGHIVAGIKAHDPDTIGNISYKLIDGDDGKFQIDSSTGNLRLKDSLDRETKDVYKLQLRASDGIQYTEATLKIIVTDTNDNPPVFSEYAYSFDVPENTVRGTRIGEIFAFDDDQGVNGQVTYQVISDWANDVFDLNPQSGVFTLTSRLDYEEIQHYIFVVQAQDGGKPSLSSTLTVYFNVIDLNDNAPLFDPMSYNNEIFENATVGTNVITVSATDLDSGSNGKIVYSITGGDENEDFAIAQNGTIYTIKELDRERKSVYNLVVTGTDSAKKPQQKLSSTVQVSIILKDVNDMSAEFITPNETSISENIPLNTVVLAVKAIDRDEGRNGYLEYSIYDPSQTFGVGAVDGLLRVIGKLDRETRANYSLEITVKDRGDPPRSSQQIILINVLDENDNSPMFDPKHYSASIAENASIGASVLQVSATDVDEGPNGRVRYSIFEGDENRDFTISEDTGVVRVAKNLNFERKSRYLLTVRAEDSSNDREDNIRYDTATISIIIRDINDNAPTFLDSPYIAYVMENTMPPPEGYIITVQASDADTPQYNGQIRYFLKEGDPSLFRINSSTGDISLLRALDRETKAEYSLTIVAMDTGTPPLTGSGTVKVVVQDLNDHSPVFDRQSYTAYILENSPIGSFVVSPSAKDLDSGLNAKIRYSFLGDKIERFMLDENTGVIRTAAALDREETSTYFFMFVAQDCSPTEPRAKAINLTINILDDNDNAPRFDFTEYTVLVPNDTEIGLFVFGAKARDDDVGKNSQITYYLQGKDSDKFTIVPDTGVVKTAVKLLSSGKGDEDYYLLEIFAKDGGLEPRITSAKLRVQLRPADWFPNITAPKENRFTLPENTAPGKVITTLSAESGKSVGNGGRIRFAIAGGNADEALKVDPTSGEVIVAGGKLDYETSPIYQVWIEAHYADNPALRRVVQIVINVTDTNDNPPVVEQQMYNASVFEEEYPPQTVCTVKADDLDSNSNGKVSYRLVDGANGAFLVDEETGEITTDTKLDREKIGTYSLVVEAVDHGVPSLTGTAVVLVTVLDKNDNPPRFTRLFSANVTENAEIGTFVIRVTSVDQDVGENANATYSFSENPGERFSLDPHTGNVTVAKPLDREAQDEYLLKVAAFDGAWRAETPLTITIQDQNDNAPEFEHSYYSFNFPEFQSSVTFVGQVLAVDRDKHGPNSVISYSLKRPSDLFTVDPATGELFSKRFLRYKHTTLESSPENQYTLTVLATDNGKPPMSSECLVTVNVIDSNNSPPKFKKKIYFSPVPKVARSGQNIMQVMARDDTDYGINAEIDYKIVGGNGTDFFRIDRKTGWITASRDVLPAEEATTYALTIEAVDKGVPPLQDEATVVLEVTGENLHTPVFPALSFQVIIPENDPVGSTMLTVVATDDDVGPNGMVEYKISSGNKDSKFSINATTGALKILKPLDYDTTNSYHLNVTATDLGFKPRQAIAMITIALTDINDNPPVFNESQYEAFIPENSPPKSLVYQVTAVDIDSPKNAIIEYSIIRGNGGHFFSIDSKTGKIYSESTLDYEDKDEYALEVLAANPDSPMFSSTKVIVHVTGINEFFPKFIKPVFHFEISESSEVGTRVGTIEASDSDKGDDGKVFYLFVGSSNDKGFSIGSETGIIYISRRLDRETQNRVVLTVMAKNAGSIKGNDTDEAQVVISIQDGNDPPEFLQGEYQVRLSEAIGPGKAILTVKAVDRDVRPQNNQFSYSIISGNVGNSFKIDPLTGIIETSSELDREKVSAYSLVVGAIDAGLPPQTGTATVHITLEDVNDNEPIFDPPNVVGYVSENEPPNTSIMTLSATDRDLHPNGPPFAYYLVGGKDKDFVRIDKTTGVIKTTKRIDRETNSQLNIIVAVEDNGVPKMKSQNAVSIVVLDQNDSPSFPRNVRILVHYFNQQIPTGKIADVHPNDPDTSGEYHCEIINPSSSKNFLFVGHGCELTAGKISPNVKYGLSVSGNDGIHSDVVSKVSVEFFQFTNSTVDNSFTVRLENMTSENFLTYYYNSFLQTAKTAFDPSDEIYLYSINDVDSGLELTIAVKNPTGYYNKAKAIENLAWKSSMEKLLKTKVIVGFMPCQKVFCQNGGRCTDGIEVMEGTRITESQTLIITSPVVLHDYSCRCLEGFAGKLCDKKPEPCSPNPCLHGGVCKQQNFDFHCSCPHSREGKFCERKKDNACDGNPCRNGGTCRQNPDGVGYFCLCRPGYRGPQCETVFDSCRPNPCLNGGICISLKPGYRCSCTQSRYGRHCDKSTFGFNELSYMTFPPLDVNTNDITIIFATVKPNALLIYNYGIQTGGRSDFVALELIGGKAVFSYGGARSAITSVTVDGGNDSLANGSWHKVTATRNGRVISLSVTSCTENGDFCEECKAGDSRCFVDDIGPTGTLNFNNNLMHVGGISSTEAILERPGQIHSDDFVGCIHSISINGRTMNMTNPVSSQNVDPVCGRTHSPCFGRGHANDVLESLNPCGEGRCLDRWKSHKCVCSGLVSTNCKEALEPITLFDGSFVEFKISEKHVRMQLLDSIYHGSTLWSRDHERCRRFAESKPGLGIPNGSITGPAKSLSLVFRTIKKQGLILYSATNKDFTSVELQNGNIVYVSRSGTSNPTVNMSVDDIMLSDGNWHNLTLYSQNRELSLFVDGKKVGEELDSDGVHDFLDPYLTGLFIGGARKDAFQPANLTLRGFEGCIANFTINNEIQPFNGSGTVFSHTTIFGKILPGCAGSSGVGAATAPDPLSIGVTLVIVFFVTLLVAILVSFVVFHLRRQNKEKGGSPMGRGNLGGSKQNGGTTIVAGERLVAAADGVLARSLHGEANLGYLTEAADAIRGHHLVAPELISKKFKERDIVNPEGQRHPRPDIIEREVVSKSPLLREELSSVTPTQISQNSHQHDANEVPEHYDLENASSIAPSDTDIVYHYKGYRDGGLRKYKATPPHVPTSRGFHHKHTGAQQQHRHSPHMTGGFPPPSRDSPRSMVPPPPVSRVESPQSVVNSLGSTAVNKILPHQSTPLARLSPSSELSSQQPRILTLSDISGKPLQTALLATTSSSGGVGKDILHSNSERSLNSPVMSQISGQSSSTSRKNQTQNENNTGSKNVAMGLTAEEIDRLNCHPRTSSLVSTLDVVSSSSEAPRARQSHHLDGPDNIPDNNSSTTTDESGNDSFTCSEIEYDNNSINGDKRSDIIFSKLTEDEDERRSRSNNDGTPNKPPLPPASYNGFDSSFRGSLSTLVASDDDLSTHVGGLLYRPPNGSPSSAAALGWDYLLNWGPNFESLVGVFKDIAELPDAVNGCVTTLRLPNQSPKPNEEYV